ncbi:DUF1810 domain-containing protein [Candidatus Nitrotoga sp. 1052]|uniref:DUF1810 domain-containing protein n=1 Tax=Candidatus Nitrotoga sp. 1052 TaxID=2886964 RepID=UPI001F9C6270|nr:conserved hypothetical protein [Candidatus Nitrotoga sp. 1052]
MKNGHESTSTLSNATTDPFDLGRFLSAQDGTYYDVVQELRSGQKLTHWMWYVFPLFNGLGTSATARHYSIKSLEEARQYLEHPILGVRLLECIKTVNRLQGRTVLQIFGTPDNMKFCSSMTLFELVAGSKSEFSFALDKYCSGYRDTATLKFLQLSLSADDRNIP